MAHERTIKRLNNIFTDAEITKAGLEVDHVFETEDGTNALAGHEG